METLGNAFNKVKDSLIWAADWVEDHPWWTLGIGAALVVLAIWAQF